MCRLISKLFSDERNVDFKPSLYYDIFSSGPAFAYSFIHLERYRTLAGFQNNSAHILTIIVAQ